MLCRHSQMDRRWFTGTDIEWCNACGAIREDKKEPWHRPGHKNYFGIMVK